MSKVIDFFSRRDARAGRGTQPGAETDALLSGFSIEVTPRTAQKIDSFAELLPQGARVYIAHIDGTDIADMAACASRLADEGMTPMPHLPARSIPDRATLEDWLRRYQGEAGVREALVIAGGRARPVGAFDSSMQLFETGLFVKRGFTRLHVAGHPEGNRDIDPDGGDRVTMAALRWKQAHARETGVEMAVATQFCFDAAPVITWCDRLRAEGVTLPVHIGVAGPAKLQTLIKYALACGVGPSLQVLQRRAADLSRLMLPFTPETLLRDLAAHKRAHPDFAVEQAHFFPLGGIGPTIDFGAGRHSRAASRARA